MKRKDAGQRVIRAAMRWFRVEGGYFFREGKVTNQKLAVMLENACAAHAKRGKRHG